MNKGALFFGLSSVVALAGVVVACSSTTTSTTTETPADEAGTKEGGTGDGGGKDSGTTDPDSGTTTDPDKKCAAEATLQECGACCIKNHPAGYKTFQDSLLGCGCNGTGADGGAPCATECATSACKSPPSQLTPACNTCLQASVGNGGACQESLSTACTASAECLAEQKCVTPCQGKP